MKLLDIPGAIAFCSGFSATPGPAQQSMQDFLTAMNGSHLKEGQPDFVAYRDCVLRESERRSLLALINFRRAHDLMITTGAPWAHVTLYYASFYACSAVVGMLGGWIDYPLAVVEAIQSSPGQQQFSVLRKSAAKKMSTYAGSHKAFWDLYYRGVSPLASWVPAHLTSPLQPVLGQVPWLIDERNAINYRSQNATLAMEQFQQGTGTFPSNLQGSLATQYRLAGESVELCFKIAATVGLQTDALRNLRPGSQAKTKFRAALRAASASLPTRPLQMRFGLG